MEQIHYLSNIKKNKNYTNIYKKCTNYINKIRVENCEIKLNKPLLYCHQPQNI